MRIAIVVPCTASKRFDPGALRLGQVVRSAVQVETRFSAWKSALSTAADLVPVRDLYAGPRWEASARVAVAAKTDRRRQVELFVASAGLGLVSESEMVRSYSATFSPGSPDSVAPSGVRGPAAKDASREWWQLLTQHGQSLRQVASCVERLVVVLSPSYLEAVRDDLVEAVRLTKTIVFATMAPPHPHLDSSWVRVGRHLRETTESRPAPVVNGMDATLPQSTAAFVVAMALNQWPDASSVQQHLDALADPNEVTIEARARAFRRPSRDDNEVRQFVRAELTLQRSVSDGQLLEQWRNRENRRCEEKRFKRLYAEVAVELASEGTHRA